MTSTHEAPGGVTVQGAVEDGYGPVMDAFVRNFTDRHDLGAGCTVYVGGRVVVDLWAGIADRRTGRAFAHDSAPVIFSCTKGVMAVCAYMLVQDGRLDLDAPIARYWPEFARAGKADITVRHALAHRAGLAYLDTDLTRDDLVAWEPVIRAIEAQAPHHGPEDGHAYHAATVGWLIGEVIRRITGLSAGAYLRRTLGDPLGLDTWIGLPAGERDHVAWMEPPLPDDDSEFAKGFAAFADDPRIIRTMTMGGAMPFPGAPGEVAFNDPVIQAAEMPGVNGISSAASLARLYAACVTGVDGAPPVLGRTFIEDGLRVQSAGPQLTGQPDDGARWGTGFQLSSAPAQPLLGSTSFGHTGAGGQLAFGDLEHAASFAYLTNQMGGYGDARARSLVDAVAAVLRG